MWHIQTPIEGLVLPTHTTGRLRLIGNVQPWQHIVRLHERLSDKADGVLAAAPLFWEIRPWHQIANRLYFQDATPAQEALLHMVRSNAQNACTLASFPKPGKRSLDSTVLLTIVVPPDRFTQYELQVRFAMTLPSGSLNITLPTPYVFDPHGSATSQRLLSPGQTALLDEIELAVSRAPLTVYTRRDLRTERRVPESVEEVQQPIVHDDSDWLTFRRDESLAGTASPDLARPRES